MRAICLLDALLTRLFNPVELELLKLQVLTLESWAPLTKLMGLTQVEDRSVLCLQPSRLKVPYYRQPKCPSKGDD